ncbi:response regulator [Sphingomonas sp. H160509]|uniref:response regulator n=1 Tax=Sphingomonas sp. H160509 TaxID=2955313 RepID=UPI002097E36E|nr:response regulator [Sphingomonas sp. H160509]MDD1450309.1 response regulator [Sphingomonas sp. H160509]
MSTESHILVIDDDPDIAKAAQLLLERHGMRVSTAANPEAAWVLLAGEPIDVILLDLNFARGRTTGEEGVRDARPADRGRRARRRDRRHRA